MKKIIELRNALYGNKKVARFLELCPLDHIAAMLAAGFCVASVFTLITSSQSFNNLIFSSGVNQVAFILVMVATVAILMVAAAAANAKAATPYTLLISSVLYAAMLCNEVAASKEDPVKIYFIIGLALVMFAVVAWVCTGNKLETYRFAKLNLPKWLVWVIAACMALAFTVFVAWVCICRYKMYWASAFDFGVFIQMFEQMRTTGLPNTTIERDIFFSHFGVHFSPFFYLLLPFYCIYPHPETLFVLQGAFIAAGVFAVVKLCRFFKFSDMATLCFIIVYIFYPTLSNGTIYDFHENKFLTVLLLWFAYAMVSKNNWLLLVFGILVMSVKEDAPIYIAAMALYMIFCQKERLRGAIVLAAALLYFAVAANVIVLFGGEIMDSRFINYMPNGQGGLGEVVKTIFFNLGFLIEQVFTPAKVPFILWMLIPVGFAPFFSKKKSMLVLFVPMLVIDLMSNWVYQFDVDFQYTYGVAALMVFMLVMVFCELKPQLRQKLLVFSAAMSIIMTSGLYLASFQNYPNTYEANKSIYKTYDEFLAKIPADASITTDHQYTAHLYYIDELYSFPAQYGQSTATDYYLLNSSTVENEESGAKAFLDAHGYVLTDSVMNLQLYKKQG
ncbi:MAG: DUF2079 domain-containing protein [Oscillospiraceae bacterium]|jgi:uncharacterized membrane protein|nr:DUF2079 domain-containing protein [Oscillospiraceae bacterium]